MNTDVQCGLANATGFDLVVDATHFVRDWVSVRVDLFVARREGFYCVVWRHRSSEKRLHIPARGFIYLFFQEALCFVLDFLGGFSIRVLFKVAMQFAVPCSLVKL
ncbi:hypothetical protein BRC82_05375 [Halobacteriales archaeon QS_1_67_19]|nr:MAG: hypothetical protein BRC82_05375 [Halobacteriales archaeon QS_1_67_19]